MNMDGWLLTYANPNVLLLQNFLLLYYAWMVGLNAYSRNTSVPSSHLWDRGTAPLARVPPSQGLVPVPAPTPWICAWNWAADEVFFLQNSLTYVLLVVQHWALSGVGLGVEGDARLSLWRVKLSSVTWLACARAAPSVDHRWHAHTRRQWETKLDHVRRSHAARETSRRLTDGRWR